MTPLCRFSDVLGDLLPYSFETSVPHSNATTNSPQIKEARHLYVKNECMQVLFLQENKARQLNTLCNKLDLILTRCIADRPLLPRRQKMPATFMSRH